MTLLPAIALSLALASPARAAEPPETLRARVLSWDLAFKPPTRKAWIARLEAEVQRALDDKMDVILFPELFAWGLAPYAPKDAAPSQAVTAAMNDEVLPALAKRLEGRDVLLVLGTYPHQDAAAPDHALNRAVVWYGGSWRFADKVHPTQGETREEPPIRPGKDIPVFAFKGGRAAALTCFSVEMPEVAAALKTDGVQLLLVPSATEDSLGVGRILRTASSRAVELGAAVLVAPLVGEIPDWKNQGRAALFLPDQKGVKEAMQVGPLYDKGMHRQDFTLPWRWLLGLRTQSEKPETRPFLAGAEFRLVPVAAETGPTPPGP